MIAVERIRGMTRTGHRQGLESLAPLLDLGIRVYVANVFFKSGLTKIQSWDTTLALFEHEYRVPLLSPEFAALLGTATELTFPVLLALGLAGRFSAFVLFAFNIVAVISYPDLNEIGLKDHMYWGFCCWSHCCTAPASCRSTMYSAATGRDNGDMSRAQGPRAKRGDATVANVASHRRRVAWSGVATSEVAA